MQRTLIALPFPSICPSIRPSRYRTVSKQMHISSNFSHRLVTFFWTTLLLQNSKGNALSVLVKCTEIGKTSNFERIRRLSRETVRASLVASPCSRSISVSSDDGRQRPNFSGWSPQVAGAYKDQIRHGNTWDGAQAYFKGSARPSSQEARFVQPSFLPAVIRLSKLLKRSESWQVRANVI